MSPSAPIVEYGPPISLTQAKQIAAAAEAEAKANGWAMVIAIVGSSGHLVLLHAMDHAQHGSVAVAQAKAATAVNFKRTTKMVQDSVAAGGVGLRMLSMDGVCALQGGRPLKQDGRIVGAIGVSGATSEEDAQVADAGAQAIGD
ncbi:MAG: heme-binding protein [Acidobacteriota bacterium]